MEIRPRQYLLDIWRATAEASFQGDKWMAGGRDGSNSISDAEQLLCIMLPVTELPWFQLARPNDTAEDILKALHVLGDSLDIPQRLIRALLEYMERYTDDSGSPVFSGGSYFNMLDPEGTLSPAQRKLDVVDSFSMSITLTLSALAFIRRFRNETRREDLHQEMNRLEELSNIRLTAAMVGLLRSFSLNVFDLQSKAGHILCRRSNQRRLRDRQIVTDLQNALQEVKSNLNTLTAGSGQAVADLDSPNRLYECGWSWGILKDAPPIEIVNPDTLEKFVQPDGVAEDRPRLYFTGIALDGIADLFSARTILQGLLDGDQNRLANALRVRQEITQSYWSTIAMFGTGRWPLEDLPWQTSDGQESSYYSLQVCSMVVQDLVKKRAPDSELGRIGTILLDLANRGRVSRRPVKDDPALEELHAPGVPLTLDGSENAGCHTVGWIVSNFAPLLLKRIFTIAGLLSDTERRKDLLTLADTVWEHLFQRRLKDGSGRDLWDQPGDAFDQLSTRHELPSWYYTERVVECLVVAANEVIDRPPVHGVELTRVATDLLNEAEHLFDRQLLIESGEAGPALRVVLQTARTNLRRARDILNESPGTAAVLANEVLRELERLAMARRDAAGGT
ncbi:MAG: SCO2524 family protein [Pseudonocardiaceae bacterium]